MATFNGDDGNNTIVGGSDNDLIQGFGGNDFLQGGGGADTVLGGTGNDAVDGNDGNDWVEGGAGNDTLTGGSGTDSFVFREMGAANADVVTDFASNWDDIRLDAAAFTNIGATGRFAAGDARFFAGAGATGGHDADDRIIYNSTTGQLFYDSDGNGGAPAQLIATLNSAPIASDLWVFGTATPPPPSGSVINGTPGNDSLVGGPGNDTINGLAGDDTIDGAAGNDSLDGGPGNDIVRGGDGNDTLIGGWNNDTLDGGAGQDTLLLADARSDVTVNLATGTMTGGDPAGTASALISNIESVDAGGLFWHINMTGSSGDSGTSRARSRLRTWPVSTMVQAFESNSPPDWPPPTRKRATSSIGFCVADRPTRVNCPPVRCCNRSRESARCAPRLFGAMAWISSTMTVRVLASILRPDTLVSRMYSDSGVVTRIWGGLRRMRLRSACGVSPVRTTVRMSTSGNPDSNSSLRIPASGSSRFFWMSFDNAFSGET